MNSFLERLFFTMSILSGIISAALLVLTTCGLRLFIVTSGSMEPAYKRGSLALIDTRIYAQDVKVGDVLVYKPESGSLVMHRLIGPDTFAGDTNMTREHIELNDTNLIGIVKYSIFIPGFSDILEKTFSMQWLFWILIILLLILSCIPWESALQGKHKSTNER